MYSYHRTLGQSLSRTLVAIRSLRQTRFLGFEDFSSRCFESRCVLGCINFLLQSLMIALGALTEQRGQREQREQRQDTTKLSSEKLQKILHGFDTAHCNVYRDFNSLPSSFPMVTNGDASESKECLQNMKCTRLYCLVSTAGITCLKRIEKTNMIHQCFRGRNIWD